MTVPSGSMGATHLLAYVGDGDSAAAIRTLMQRRNVKEFTVEPGSATDAAEFLATHASPQTLIVEVPSSEAAPRMLDALADVVHPSTRVIVTGKIDALSFYHWLMGLGIHDYLLQPFTEAQLEAALTKTSPGKTAAKPTEDDAASQKKTVAVIGARGGVGTTSIATALATLLAHDYHLPTALIDADAQFGSVALGLDLEPSRGVRDALEKPDRIDSLFLERVMMKLGNHLSILSAEEPLTELLAPHVSAGELLFAGLRERFAFMVVDLPRQITPLSRYVLSSADHVVVVAEPSILSLRDALRLKDLLTETMKRPAPIVLVNREGMAARQEPSREQFAKHLGITPAYYVPYMAEMIAATARGQTVLDEAKLAPIATVLRQVAGSIGGAATAVPARKAARGLGALLKGRP